MMTINDAKQNLSVWMTNPEEVQSTKFKIQNSMTINDGEA